MNNTKTTKRALLSSVMAMLICVAMLIGTTFAWFTDSASTAVNKIQAGKLKVQLLDAAGNDLNGTTLTWVTSDGKAQNDILWEPGCTYRLNDFKIRNNGNLALKYKIIISGIVGDNELLNAIDFTVSGVTDAETATALNGFEGHLTANSETALITITGKMKKDAGNEYQGKSIDGIGITIYATQYASEYDSYGKTYDNNATYRVNSPSVTVPQTGDITLQTNESDPVMVKLPAAALTSNTTATPTSVSLRHSGVYTDSENKTVEFDDLEIVDENGNVIDFSNNTTHTLDITLPVSNIANGTQVKVYHDGNLVAVTTVQDGMITYQVNHLCDVKVVSVNDNENATQTTNDKMTGNRYTGTENLSNKKITHTFSNTKRDAMALYIKGSSANITFEKVDFTLTQGVRVTDSQVKRNFGIFVYDGANLTFNSGNYNVSGLDTYFMWIQDNTNNSIVTINGGNFTSNSQGAMFACYSTNSKLVINGGFFDQSAGNPNLTLQGGKNYGKGEIVVKGGTFVNFNPQEHVADGYKVVAATQNDGKVHYEVVKTN